MEGRFKVFMGLINLRKICNHPDIYDGAPKHIGASISDDEERNDHEYGYWKRSGKMIVVEALLKLWKKQNHEIMGLQLNNYAFQFLRYHHFKYILYVCVNL